MEERAPWHRLAWQLVSMRCSHMSFNAAACLLFCLTSSDGSTHCPTGQPLNTQYAGAALFLWIGVFLVAAIGYGSTQDPKYAAIHPYNLIISVVASINYASHCKCLRS